MAALEFDKVVAIKFGMDWIAIDNVQEAQACLLNLWPERSGASYLRALDTCEACLAGEAPIMAVRASLMVAAMEAGLPVELHHDRMAFVDFQIAAAARDNVIDDLDSSASDDAMAENLWPKWRT